MIDMAINIFIENLRNLHNFEIIYAMSVAYNYQ